MITFQGKSVRELEQAFRESVDDYLAFCAKRKEKPEKPFSGTFLVRATRKLHRRLALEARREGKSLNATCCGGSRREALLPLAGEGVEPASRIATIKECIYLRGATGRLHA